MNELNSINSLLVFLNTDELVRTFLYGDNGLDTDSNFKRLIATIKSIKSTQQFDEPLF